MLHLRAAAGETASSCSGKAIPLVMGTTGLSDAQLAAIKAAARKIPILYGTNMSVGMNVLFAVVGKVAALHPPDVNRRRPLPLGKRRRYAQRVT